MIIIRYLLAFLIAVVLSCFAALYVTSKPSQRPDSTVLRCDTAAVVHDTVYAVPPHLLTTEDSACRDIVNAHISHWEEHIDNWFDKINVILVIISIAVVLCSIGVPIWSYYESKRSESKLRDKINKIEEKAGEFDRKISSSNNSYDKISRQITELNKQIANSTKSAEVLKALQSLITLNGLRDFYRKDALIYNDLHLIKHIMDASNEIFDDYIDEISKVGDKAADVDKTTLLIIYQQVITFLQRYLEYIRSPKYLYEVSKVKNEIVKAANTLIKDEPIDAKDAKHLLDTAFKTMKEAFNDEFAKYQKTNKS